ncbi:MAG TPA: glycerophosphodiester phosphodiesterase family protein [Kiloniellales bacterium]|nr:glycerophosphodiester phosphodiesterase family protein [Kiloniellales bacterium]
MFALPKVMGHRGAAAHAPENTLAGLRAAAAQGARWVEFDVMLTGDSVPVLFHDDNLKRLTGRNALMARTSFAELGALEAGRWFDPAFAGEPIPSLEQAAALVVELGLTPNIEIKPTPGRDAETAREALSVLRQCWPADRPPPLVSSFSRIALEIARELAPDWPRGFLAWRLPRDWTAAAERLGCVTVHLRAERLSRRTIARVHEAGYALAAFTVNRPTRARRLWARGCDCIISDRPGEILAVLEP